MPSEDRSCQAKNNVIHETHIFPILRLAEHFQLGEAFAQEIEFSKETFANDVMTLPYRKANIPGYFRTQCQFP